MKASPAQAGVDLEAALKEDAANRRKPAVKQRAGGVLIAPKDRPPVSKVLLVGGATRMPTFQRFVENMTGIKPDPLLVDPDLVRTLKVSCDHLQKRQGVAESISRKKMGAYQGQRCVVVQIVRCLVLSGQRFGESWDFAVLAVSKHRFASLFKPSTVSIPLKLLEGTLSQPKNTAGQSARI